MEKSIYNKQTGISYTLQGDYYLPDLALLEQEDRHIGLWGQRHLRYIKQHHKVQYTNLLTSGKLNYYLADIDKQAEDMFFQLVKRMAEREGVTEQLKADNPMEWVARINNIRNRVTEIINIDIIIQLNGNGGRNCVFLAAIFVCCYDIKIYTVLKFLHIRSF